MSTSSEGTRGDSRIIPPLPHPSWLSETPPADTRPVDAAEFWRRLGL